MSGDTTYPGCAICKHSRVTDIDALINTANRNDPNWALSIAQQFGLSHRSVKKHAEHIIVTQNLVRLCHVCRHQDKHLIEEAINGRMRYIEIARRFFIPNVSSIREHVTACMGKTIDSARGDIPNETLEQRCEKLVSLVEGFMQDAADDAEATFADKAKLVTAAKGALELLARLVGKLGFGSEQSILDHPKWRKIQDILTSELQSQPQIAKRIAARLQDEVA